MKQLNKLNSIAVKLIAGAMADAVIEGRDGKDTAEETEAEAAEEAAE